MRVLRRQAQRPRRRLARSPQGHVLAAGSDEPTGALDLDTPAEVLDLLRELVDEWEQTVVMVTHDPAAAAPRARRVVVADGRIDAYLPHPDAAELARRLTTLGKPSERTAGERRRD